MPRIVTLVTTSFNRQQGLGTWSATKSNLTPHPISPPPCRNSYNFAIFTIRPTYRSTSTKSTRNASAKLLNHPHKFPADPQPIKRGEEEMPGALLGHASSMSANPAAQGGEIEAGDSGMQTGMIAQDVRRAGQPKKDVPVCPTDDEAIVPRRKTKNTSRQSWDYVWKSGVAGGLAGCAVCSRSSLCLTISPFPVAY